MSNVWTEPYRRWNFCSIHNLLKSHKQQAYLQNSVFFSDIVLWLFKTENADLRTLDQPAIYTQSDSRQTNCYRSMCGYCGYRMYQCAKWNRPKQGSAFLDALRPSYMTGVTYFVTVYYFSLSISVNWWHYFTHDLTHAPIYINTTVFTLKQSYMFQPSRGHPQGILIHFMSQGKNTHVQMQISD
jgi:hypothetical protein